jgi:hypothetical protein
VPTVARRRLVQVLFLVAVATTLAGVAGAHASSIVYIKGGDVWLAKSNGKSQRAITKNGTRGNPYRSPAYSNKGVITAVRGRRDIYFFNRRGKQVRKKRNISAGPLLPFDPVIIDHAISPDGRRLASTLWMTTRVETPKPGEPTGTDYGTTIWYTNAKSGKLLEAGTTDGGQSVSWITNSRPLVWAPNVFLSPDAYLVDLSAPNSPTGWFQDNMAGGIVDGEPLDDGELTRAQDKLAAVRGPNTTASSAPTMLRIYAVSSLSAPPAVRCDLQAAPNSRIESPSWSPDGKSLAWGQGGGIWVSPIAAGTGDCGAAPKRLIAGGSEPDWGPADAPRGRG